ncbi:hypothetical protein RQP46_007267 [Phenoliferia psychrophenolica]
MGRLKCDTRAPKPSVALIKRRREELHAASAPPRFEPPLNFLGHLYRHFSGWTKIDMRAFGGWTEDGLAAFVWADRLDEFVEATQGTAFPLVKPGTLEANRVRSFWRNCSNWNIQRPRIADRHGIAKLNHLSAESVILLIHNEGLLSRFNSASELKEATCRVPASKQQRVAAARLLASFANNGVVFGGGGGEQS